MGATLAPERILRQLTELWVSLGQPSGETGAGVLRACSMTLVVLAEESEDTQALGETMAALMPVHPARAILIRLRGAGPPTLSDRVYAQCWLPFGQRRQICCEQIEITATDASLADLAPVILALAVPDLPLVVWCRSPRLVQMPEFPRIAAMAHKVVVDSVAFPDAKAALRLLAAQSARGVLLGDLAWTRLTRWRQMLAQLFENRKYVARLPEIAGVRVGFSPGNEPLAWYMGAWAVDALADASVRAELAVAPENVASLRVRLSGGDFTVELDRREETLVVTAAGLENRMRLSQPTDYLLLREELSIVRRDPVFDKTLASAAALAYPVIK